MGLYVSLNTARDLHFQSTRQSAIYKIAVFTPIVLWILPDVLIN